MKSSRTTGPPDGLSVFETELVIPATRWWRFIAVVLGTVIATVAGYLVSDQPAAFTVSLVVGSAALLLLVQPSRRGWWERSADTVATIAVAASAWFSGRAESPVRLLLTIPVVYSAMVYGPRRIMATAATVTVARLALESGSPLTRDDVAHVVTEIGVTFMLGLAVYMLRLYLQRTRDDLEDLVEDMSYIRETGRAHLSERRRFERFAEAAPVGIYLLRLTPEPNFEYVNPALEQISGLTRDQFEADATVGVNRLVDGATERLRHARRSLADWTEPVRVKQQNPDGQVRWHDIREFAYEGADGQVVGVQGIVDEVTDVVQGQERLAAALEREQDAVLDLTRANQMKDVFLQSVSHELRTPLASIVGFSETLVLRPDAMDHEQRKFLLERLLSNAHRLHNLLSDLLDVDRLSRGVMSLERVDVDLADLVATCIADIEAPSRIVVRTEPAVVAVDGPKVSRVIENLVVNGLRHGGPSSTVWVEVSTQPWGARLVVEDNGPGIPPDLRTTITDPFVQGPESSSAPRPGTGIGLSLVLRLVELHDGRLTIADRPGGGARLVVDLPRDEHHDLPGD